MCRRKNKVSRIARFYLFCQCNQSKQVISSLNENNTLDDLRAVVSTLCNISPSKLDIFVGNPRMALNKSMSSDVTLKEYGIHSGDVIFAEEIRPKLPLITAKEDWPLPGILVRRPIAADNSCLFNSIAFAISGGDSDDDGAQELRQTVARAIADDPEYYNEAILGKPNEEYVNWVQMDTSWGGAIEISILSKFYQIEIAVIDTLHANMTRFGEEHNYPRRIMLSYTGSHYEPIVLEPPDGSNKCIQTIFNWDDEGDIILSMAMDMAHEAQSTHDISKKKAQQSYYNKDDPMEGSSSSGSGSNASKKGLETCYLQCRICGEVLYGHAGTKIHAAHSGHSEFQEIANPASGNHVPDREGHSP